MKTGQIAALIASIRGGNPPKPATKAKAIELFWLRPRATALVRGTRSNGGDRDKTS